MNTNLGPTGITKKGQPDPAIQSLRTAFDLRGDIQGDNACVTPSLSLVLQTSPTGFASGMPRVYFICLLCFSLQLFSTKAPSSLSRGWVTLNNEESRFSATLFLLPLFNHVFVGRSVGPGEQCWHLDLWRGGIFKFRQLQEGRRYQPVGHSEGDEGFSAPHSQS